MLDCRCVCHCFVFDFVEFVACHITIVHYFVRQTIFCTFLCNFCVYSVCVPVAEHLAGIEEYHCINYLQHRFVITSKSKYLKRFSLSLCVYFPILVTIVSM